MNNDHLIQRIKKATLLAGIITTGILAYSCMLFPYYKNLPYLPAVNGSVVDIEGNGLYEVKVYWENEKQEEQYRTFTDINGNYELKVIYKYITWKFIAMDTGWGGTLVFEKEGYQTIKKNVVGFYEPAKAFEVMVQLDKIK